MPESPAFDPTIQTEKIAFDPDVMVECGACGRANPPNRLKCIYCAKELELDGKNAAAIKPSLRRLEVWEHGFNLIVRDTSVDANIDAIARLLSIEHDEVTAILDAPSPLPLARLESEIEALVVERSLSEFGLICTMVSDSDLAPERPPVRLSKMDLLDDSLLVTDFNTNQHSGIPLTDVVLLVAGVITSGRVDSLEKKRRGKKSKLLDEMATSADEMLLDVYTRSDARGFRIHTAGFDFSCLGGDMGLLAGENLRLLTVHLSECLPNVRLVTDYARVGRALDRVWEVESRKDSQGLQRAGFGKVEFGSTASSNNLNQFTKYSRLQWHLL